MAGILAWVARNTAPVSALAEPATARQMLDLATGTATHKITRARHSRRSAQQNGTNGGWGGWDSNPGPADYESAALTG